MPRLNPDDRGGGGDGSSVVPATFLRSANLIDLGLSTSVTSLPLNLIVPADGARVSGLSLLVTTAGERTTSNSTQAGYLCSLKYPAGGVVTDLTSPVTILTAPDASVNGVGVSRSALGLTSQPFMYADTPLLLYIAWYEPVPADMGSWVTAAVVSLSVTWEM